MLALVVPIVAALVAPFAARSSAAGDADRARPVVLAGDAVPGGGTFERFSVESLPIVAPVTSEGRVAFFATILRGRASEGFFVWSEGKVAKVRRGRESLEAIYVASAGKLRKVVAQGDAAPAGGGFAGFGAPVVNAKGIVAFAAVVEGPAVPGGLFVSEDGKIRMVLGAGDDAPIGGIFAQPSERIAFNGTGAIAFNAVPKRGPAPAGIFAVTVAIARDGGGAGVDGIVLVPPPP